MFDWLARLATRWPRAVLVITAGLLASALLYGFDVVSGLKTGGQVDPASESSVAAAALDHSFPGSRPNLVLLVRSSGSVDDPAVAAEGRRLAQRLGTEAGVDHVTSYWQQQAPSLRSRDGHQAVIVARVAGDQTQAQRTVAGLTGRFAGQHGPAEVLVGGPAAIRNELTSTVRGDISRAEAIGIPLTAIVLILVMRGFFAALFPLLVGALSVVGTNAALKLISQFTDVSVFALNLATGLSLGLAADYGLFIVKRYREELRRGHDVPTAMRITLNTAGRTVAFSSLTVAVAVSSMLIFPLYFLRSFAFAGISVVLIAATAALVALPAALVVSGRFLDLWDFTVPFVRLARRLRGGRPAPEATFWRRAAETVMRRPAFFAIGGTALLLLLGAPFLRVNFGLPDDRLLPASYPSHQVQQALRTDFPTAVDSTLTVYLPEVDASVRGAEIASYATALSRVPGVTGVATVTGTYRDGRATPPGPASARYATGEAAYLSLDSSVEAVSTQGQDLVRAVRAVPAPFRAEVAGTSAELLDALTALKRTLPVALAIIAATTLVLIFLLTGSVLIPLKAVLMNTLSLSATFGALVWIFQDYHLASILDFQRTGWVDVSLLVLLFCVAFGVSMDYEVFLLSRMKEEYQRTRDNRTAVVYGIEKTGGIVTAAALITSIVFIAMATSRVTNIKMFGVGLALAMLMDASLVRTILVPALMRLAGQANWWAPAPLRWVYRTFGLRESDDVPPPAPAPVPHPEPLATPARQ